WMQNRVAAGNIKIRQTLCLSAKLLTVLNHCKHIFRFHFFKFGVTAKRINIAMFTSLVAGLRDMPLKCKIFHLNLSFSDSLFSDFSGKPRLPAASRKIHSFLSVHSNRISALCYLSPAPQAVPHAAG